MMGESYGQHLSLLLLPLHASPLLPCGSSMGYSPLGTSICASADAPRAAGEYQLCHGAPPSPLFLTLVFALLFRSFFFPLLHPVQCFLPFLKHVFTEVPPVWLTGSPVSSCNRLEPVVSSQRQPLPPANISPVNPILIMEEA